MRSNFLRAGLFGTRAAESPAPYKIEPGQKVTMVQGSEQPPQTGLLDRIIAPVFDDIEKVARVFSIR